MSPIPATANDALAPASIGPTAPRSMRVSSTATDVVAVKPPGGNTAFAPALTAARCVERGAIGAADVEDGPPASATAAPATGDTRNGTTTVSANQRSRLAVGPDAMVAEYAYTWIFFFAKPTEFRRQK